MKCVLCEEEHDGTFVSGRFCSRVCATTFVSRQNREQKNLKISRSIRRCSRRHVWTCSKCLRRFKTRSSLARHHKEHPKQWYITVDGYKTDGSRRNFLIRELGSICQICQNSEWMGQQIPIELHHVDGNPENNVRENLRLICPNCHAQTPTYKGRNIGKVKNSKRQRKMKRYSGLYR